MKKTVPYLVILLLLLSGCADSEIFQSPPAHTPPEVTQHSLRPYVPLEELREQYDLGMLFPQFDISETTVDSVRYYKFSDKNSEAFALIEEGQASMTIHSGSKSATFSIETVFPTATEAPASLTIADVTNDGIGELIYIASSGGTGSLYSICRIIDLSTLTEYPIEDFAKTLESQIEMTPQCLIDHGAVLCKIVLHGQAPVYGVVQGTQGVALANYEPLPASASSYISIGWDSASTDIQLGVGLTLNNAAPGNYLCTVQGTLLYDSKLKRFDAGPPYRVLITDQRQADGAVIAP